MYVAYVCVRMYYVCSLCMYICIYAFMCVYVCIIYVAYVYIYVCMCLRMHVCMYIRGLFTKYPDWNCSGCSLGGMCLQPVLTCSYMSWQLMTQVESDCVCSVGCSRSRK